MSILETDRIDLALAADGDLDGVTEGLRWTSGYEATRQECQIACLLIRGEVFTNLGLGIPYLERDGVPAEDAILGERWNEGKRIKVLGYYRDALLGVSTVKRIDSLTAEFNGTTRRLAIAFTVVNVFGDTITDTLERAI